MTLTSFPFSKFELLDGLCRQAQVSIDGHRYIFIRAEAIVVDYSQFLMELCPNDKQGDARLFAARFVFDFAKVLGKTDQRFYARRMGCQVCAPALGRQNLPAYLSLAGFDLP